MTAPKVRISGFSLKSYLSSGKSLAIVRIRRLTEAKWPRTDCAVVRGRLWPNAGRVRTNKMADNGSAIALEDTFPSFAIGRDASEKVIRFPAPDHGLCPGRIEDAWAVIGVRSGMGPQGVGREV